MKIPKQEYTPEFRALAVRRIKEGVKFGALNKELWVNDDPAQPDAGGLTKQAARL